jgi:hypothetical protein
MRPPKGESTASQKSCAVISILREFKNPDGIARLNFRERRRSRKAALILTAPWRHVKQSLRPGADGVSIAFG